MTFLRTTATYGKPNGNHVVGAADIHASVCQQDALWFGGSRNIENLQRPSGLPANGYRSVAGRAPDRIT